MAQRIRYLLVSGLDTGPGGSQASKRLEQKLRGLVHQTAVVVREIDDSSVHDESTVSWSALEFQCHIAALSAERPQRTAGRSARFVGQAEEHRQPGRRGASASKGETPRKKSFFLPRRSGASWRRFWTRNHPRSSGSGDRPRSGQGAGGRVGQALIGLSSILQTRVQNLPLNPK